LLLFKLLFVVITNHCEVWLVGAVVVVVMASRGKVC
jgi:hypothetical protein